MTFSPFQGLYIYVCVCVCARVRAAELFVCMHIFLLSSESNILINKV